MNDGDLIDLVRQFPLIYDKRNSDFKNKVMRQNAWKTIASLMFSSDYEIGQVQEVENRWNVLRNRFTTELRLLKNVPSGSGATSGWQHFDAMSFLAKFIQERKTKGSEIFSPSTSQPASHSGSSTTQETPLASPLGSPTNLWSTQIIQPAQNETVSPADDVRAGCSKTTLKTSKELSSDQGPHDTSTPKNVRKRKRDDDDNIIKRITSTLDKITNYASTSTTNESDEDLLFGQMVGASLKKIKNRRAKFQIKRKIMELFEEECESDD